MVRKVDRPRHIIDHTLNAAAASGWARLTLRDIAVASEMSLADVHAVYSSKHAILAAYLRSVDVTVLAGEAPEDENPRDRLFDVLMQRFDALNANRTAVVNILGVQACNPLSALALAPQMLCSMSLMLEVANIKTTGIVGALRMKGLAAVWLATLRVWRNDESPDMAATMAALDRYLGHAELFARRLPHRAAT